MKSIETALGKLTVGDQAFLRFAPASGKAPWQCQRPLRLLMWDGPCQRQTVVEQYDYRLDFQGQRGLVQRFRVFIPSVCLRFDMDIEAAETGFLLRLFPATVIEERPRQLRLLEADLLPDFWSARRGEEGFFLLPHYSGTLFHFNLDREIEQRSMIYLEQPRWEHLPTMPMFGCRTANGAWLGILSSGQFDARIVTRSRKETEGFVYTINPSFVFRHDAHDPMVGDIKELRLTYFPEPHADCNTMAVAYRDDLIRRRGLRPLRERVQDNPILAYAARSYHCKIFQGIKAGLVYDGEEEMTVSTTFAEAETIAREMKTAGVEECVFWLVGWNPEGHDGRYPTRFPVEPRLGGEAGFRKLRQTLDELGYRLSVHDNHVDLYPISVHFARQDLLTDRAGHPVGGSHWGGGAAWRACPAAFPTPKSLLDFERMKKLGVNGIYYLDAMPGPLYSCFHPKHPISRRGCAEGLRRLAQSARDEFGALVTEIANDYLAEAQDMIYALGGPFRELTPFQEPLPFADEWVPFYHVAFHGLQLYHVAGADGWKKMAPTPQAAAALELAVGAMPRHEVACRALWGIPAYREWLPAMAHHYRIVCREHAELQQMFINAIRIDRSSAQIETTFEDGRTLRVGMNDGQIAWRR
ncbi:MAG: DUF5696 domain-containing protein [Kiritimatiellae bacterium]|nr:DUF5696 domain-containing protein [Kiritimatiellia bacterium]